MKTSRSFWMVEDRAIYLGVRQMEKNKAEKNKHDLLQDTTHRSLVFPLDIHRGFMKIRNFNKRRGKIR